jgi:hypothetical protein
VHSLSQNMALGIRQCIDANSPAITVMAMTFVACSVCTSEVLENVLETGQSQPTLSTTAYCQCYQSHMSTPMQPTMQPTL